ncbi:MAG TPA: DoxX family protein [Dongiaceae bacterium]|nr:DoxX family protein [Dongiaceae bacterium]
MSSSATGTGLTRHAPVVLSILRLVAGLLFLEHGTQKLFGFPASEHMPDTFTLAWFAGILEAAGGLLVALGLFTRQAAFIISGEMAFAYFIAHFPRSFFPVLNGGDAAILYCFVFLYLVFAGPGPISLDASLRRKSGY